MELVNNPILILIILVLAIYVGYHVVWNVTPALHTPLMAVTNTPSLGAGQQVLAELSGESSAEIMGMGYAIAYPIGILGILFSMWFIRIVFRIDVNAEERQYEESLSQRQRKA